VGSLIGPSHTFSLRLILSIAWLPIFFHSPLHAEVLDDPPIGRHYDIPVIIEILPPEDTYQISKSAVADLTGDGRSSVIYFGRTPGWSVGYDTDPQPLYIMIPNEDGILENRVDDVLVGPRLVMQEGAHTILPADFNNDGRTDLFFNVAGPEVDGLNDPGGQNLLLLMGEDGRLTNVTATHLPQFSDKSHFSTIGDYDGDGDVDIFVNILGGGPEEARESPGDSGYLMFNDGTGHFTVVADFGGTGPNAIVGPNGRLPENANYSAWALVAVDADGDGDLDIYIGQAKETEFCSDYPNCSWGATRVILMNEGDGRFLTVKDPMPDAGPLGQRVTIHTEFNQVYDVNNDGLDDLLLHQLDGPLFDSGEDAFFFQILVSNGDGTFRDETNSRYPNDFVGQLTQIILHDLDRDGHKDIFTIVNYSFNDIRINDGEGYFRPLRSDWITRVGSEFSIVMDVDGDGDTDFYDMG